MHEAKEFAKYMREAYPGKLSPKKVNLIEDIIRSANSLFFGKLAKLLQVQFPVELEEKRKLLKKILSVWENR
ncbi:MAG: hypothetical protein ACXACF_01610 [Candidatus Hermodarchaeia archaeon]|jgi:hypothetical protein